MNKFKILFTILFFLSISVLFAQEEKITNVLSNNIENNGINKNYTVWIFFNDKGDITNEKISNAKSLLSKHALERRQKLLKSNSLTDLYDIPVEKSYVNKLTPFLVKIRHQSKWLNAVSAEVSGEQINKIASLNFVKSIDIVRKGKYDKELIKQKEILSRNSNKNSKYNLNYGSSITQLEQINVPTVHDLGYDGSGLIICVMDAGFNNLEHQAFGSLNIIDSWDFVNNDDNVDDEGDMGTGNHGTMTLSTIGGFYEGELIGPAYGASYLLAKTENTDSETQIEEDNWVAAAEWAEALGADITSTSLGYIDFDDGSGYNASELDGNTAIITIAADIAASKGILVVNSAGNEGPGTTTIGAPADGDSVLAIGAVNPDRSRTYFSSVGPTGDGRIKPEVMAMGSGVIVAETSGNSYTTASGTSFSCPLSAGAAALLWEMVPTASNMDIFNALKMSADNADSPNNEYGWGIIDIYAAYEYLALPQINHVPLTDSEDFNGPYTVFAEVSSNYDLITDSPKLFYRTDNGSWVELTMSLSKESNTYTADIPGTGSSAVYDYYLTAENSNALVLSPDDAPTGFYSFNVAPDSEVPQINHNTIAEYYLNLWGQAQIIAELTDNLGIDTDNSFVEWKINGTSQSNINFINTSENLYSAYFPYSELSFDDLIEYRIIAQDISEGQNVSVFPLSGFQSFNISDRISFEQNQFSHNWTFEGNDNWFVTSNQQQNGSYSAQSGIIDNSEVSSISLNFTCDDSGSISFYKKVSSEEDWDFLNFYINDILQDEWSGIETGFTEESYDIPAGAYTLKWEYDKDGSVSDGNDCAWIDNITLPGIENTYTVTFNVTDGTIPIEDANVNFISSDILTDASGQAIFPETVPGNNIQYIVSKSGYDHYSGSLSVINQDISEDIVLTNSVDVRNLDLKSIKVYPNPAKDIISFDIQDDELNTFNIDLYSYSGKLLKQFSSYQNRSIIDISDIPDGIYVCKIKSARTVEFVKIIKKK